LDESGGFRGRKTLFRMKKKRIKPGLRACERVIGHIGDVLLTELSISRGVKFILVLLMAVKV